MLGGHASGNYFEEQHQDHNTYKAAIDEWRRIVAASE